MKNEGMLSEYKGLAEKVAQHLTGRPITVRFQAPAATLTAGMAYKVMGQGYIDLDPALRPDLQYKVFLHEAAHLRLDWGKIDADPTVLKFAPKSVEFTAEEIREEQAQPDEKKADNLAVMWGNWADYHRFEWTKQYPGELICRLAALLEFPTERFK